MPDTNAQILKDFITSSDILDDEKKNGFKDTIDNLQSMKAGTDQVSMLEQLNAFIDESILTMEREAINARDTDRINELTNLRNARIEFEKQLLGIEEDI